MLAAILFLYPVRCPLYADSPEASSYARAVAAYQDRRLDEAFTYAKEAVAKEPSHVEALALLGELYYLRQELTKAKESWKEALALAPSRQDIRQMLQRLEKESQVEKTLARSDTYPFVVRFAEGEMPGDLGDLKLLLRDTHRLVGQSLGYFPDHTITVLLYPEADFAKVKSVSHQVAGLYDGKIRLPLSRTGQGGRELQAILWHEYTHALVHDLSKGKAPVWLNEGIAVYQEARARSIDLNVFRLALRAGKAIPWEALWKQEYDPASLELCYQEGYLIVTYLVKRWGMGDLVKLLSRLGQGYPMADALRAQYKEEPQLLEKEWLTWAKRQLL